MPKQQHLLLNWLIFSGLVLFGLTVAFDQGLLWLLISSDRSRICLIIGVLYIVGTIHCARRIYYISNELLHTSTGLDLLAEYHVLAVTADGIKVNNEQFLPQGLLSEYLLDVISARGDSVPSNNSNLLEVYASRVKGPSDFGWFLAEITLKLGLLGTIIGFILMLASIAGTSNLDPDAMQNVLRQMSVGMGTALYTTLTGLLGSMLLSAQFLLLDRASQQLLDQIVHCAELLGKALPSPNIDQ